MTERVEAASRLWDRAIAPIALFVLAFAIRALPVQGILLDGRTLFFGHDAYYHMRRIMYSVVHFPATLGFDRYINHPDGARAIWTPVFDWLVAALLRPFHGSLGPVALERIAVWVPPALGSATVVAVYFLGSRFLGRRSGLLAGVVLSLLTGHFWYSQVGFIDHHAAVALVAVWVLGAGMGLVAASDQGAAVAATTAWRRCASLGGSYALALLLWPGMLLHVGLVEIGLLAHLATRPARAEAVRFACWLAFVHALAFALVLPFGLTARFEQWGSFSPVVLSGFQPWYFGAAALFSAACAALWHQGIGAATRPGRFASAAAVAVAVLAISGLSFEGLATELGDAWEWFAKRDAFMEQVSESRSLFVSRDGFTLRIALQRLSTFSLLLPLVFVCGTLALRRRADRSALSLLLWWSFGLFAATVLQRRFFNSASIGLALLFAWSFRGAFASLPASLRRHPLGRRAALAVLALAATFLLVPVFVSYRPYIANLVSGLRGEAATASLDTRRHALMVGMASWLYRNTPEPSNWLDPTAKPTYGILAPWTLGHILEYEARRPTVTTNFGDDVGDENFLLARRYYQSEEGPASEILERLNVRYVIAPEFSNFLAEAPVPGSMFFALFGHDGLGGRGAPGEAPVPALERHRLIHESRSLRGGGRAAPALFKVFEHVPGARIVGRAPPGTRLHAELQLKTNRGRVLRYRAETIASEAGRYAFRVPYANRGGPEGVRPGAFYRITSGASGARVSVDEAAVAGGAEVAGPDF